MASRTTMNVNTVRAFQETHTRDLHPAFNEPHPWDDQSRAYVAAPNSASIRTKEDIASDDFRIAIQNFRIAAGTDRTIQGIGNDLDIRGSASWSDVLAEARRAEQKHKEAGRGWKGAHISFFRELGGWATQADPWLDLLGSNEYSALVCAGLRIIIQAAVFETEKREHILSSMAGLPQTIKKAQEQRVTFIKDNELRPLAMTLYVEILGLTQAMIEWLVGEKRLKKVALDLFSHKDKKERKIDERLIDVEKSIQAIRDRVEVMLQRAIMGTEAHAGAIDDRTVIIHTDIHAVQSNLGVLQQTLQASRLAEKQRDLELQRLCQEFQAQRNSAEAQTALFRVLLGDIERAYWFQLQEAFRPATHCRSMLTEE